MAIVVKCVVTFTLNNRLNRHVHSTYFLLSSLFHITLLRDTTTSDHETTHHLSLSVVCECEPCLFRSVQLNWFISHVVNVYRRWEWYWIIGQLIPHIYLIIDDDDVKDENVIVIIIIIINNRFLVISGTAQFYWFCAAWPSAAPQMNRNCQYALCAVKWMDHFECESVAGRSSCAQFFVFLSILSFCLVVNFFFFVFSAFATGANFVIIANH